MYIPVTFEKARNFRYGLAAIDLIEKRLGKRISEIDFRKFGRSTTVMEKTIILWAGLVHEDPTLTPESLLEIMDKNNVLLADVIPLMFDAIDNGFGGDKKENPKKAAGQKA